MKSPWYRTLYVQVLIAVVVGALVGVAFPAFGASLKPLGDGFVKLVKCMIAPIVFVTVVHGVASMGDVKRLGRVGVKSLVYFEVVSTAALAIGLIVVNVLRPGGGFTPVGQAFHASGAAGQGFLEKAHALNTTEFLLNVVPPTLFAPLASGDLLQTLLVAILAAFAITGLGERGAPVLNAIESIGEVLFGVMSIVVRVAPLGAFGAMGFTVGSFGIASLAKLASLMAGFYLTSALFVFVVLGLIARFAGFSIVRFVVYIKDELLLVLGTSSSETALPGLMSKLQRLGCSRATVGLVVPTG